MAERQCSSLESKKPVGAPTRERLLLLALRLLFYRYGTVSKSPAQTPTPAQQGRRASDRSRSTQSKRASVFARPMMPAAAEVAYPLLISPVDWDYRPHRRRD